MISQLPLRLSDLITQFGLVHFIQRYSFFWKEVIETYGYLEIPSFPDSVGPVTSNYNTVRTYQLKLPLQEY